MKTAQHWIKELKLIPHEEGGYFAETYRDELIIAFEHLPEKYSGPRNVCTAIYYLLESQQMSALHRIKSAELWHHYAGSTLTLHVIHPNGEYEKIKIGPDVGIFQALVKPGCWFGATVDESNTYTLVGCTVSPGFDSDDFEMANREKLLAEYPQHQEIIERLTNHSYSSNDALVSQKSILDHQS